MNTAYFYGMIRGAIRNFIPDSVAKVVVAFLGSSQFEPKSTLPVPAICDTLSEALFQIMLAWQRKEYPHATDALLRQLRSALQGDDLSRKALASARHSFNSALNGAVYTTAPTLTEQPTTSEYLAWINHAMTDIERGKADFAIWSLCALRLSLVERDDRDEELQMINSSMASVIANLDPDRQ